MRDRARRIVPLFVVVFVIGLLTLCSAASAHKPGQGPEFDGHSQLSHVADELEQLWEEEPQLFARLEAVRDIIRQWESDGATRPIEVVSVLTGLGDDGLLPMMWALVGDDPRQEQFGLQGWTVWRVSLIEAIGRLRDERSIPVMLSILEGPDPLQTVHRPAVTAIGRTGDVDAIETVVDIARDDDNRRPAIVEGLGLARRIVALDYLLEVAADDGNRQLQRRAVRALGDWGNQWAWQTSSLAAVAKEGAQGRSRIIETLVDHYAQAPQDIRGEMEKSLQLVGASASAAAVQRRLESVQGEPSEDAYQRLLARLNRSPL